MKLYEMNDMKFYLRIGLIDDRKIFQNNLDIQDLAIQLC